jgi:hypothetical protein
VPSAISSFGGLDRETLSIADNGVYDEVYIADLVEVVA